MRKLVFASFIIHFTSEKFKDESLKFHVHNVRRLITEQNIINISSLHSSKLINRSLIPLEIKLETLTKANIKGNKN